MDHNYGDSEYPHGYPDYSRQASRRDVPSLVMSIISMVAGIDSICLIRYWFVNLPLAAAAIVLAFLVKRKHSRKTGMANTGLITGAIGAGVGMLALISAVLTAVV